MGDEPETWTLRGLLSHIDFLHKKMPDQALAWVLGAGASRPSAIPTGGELVARWLRELHERLDTSGDPVAVWATATNLGIERFDYANAAAFYPRLYERRFRDDPEEGYACLEDLMVGIEPSPGYSILAKIMEKERHRVAITTNFDNLLSDALAIYTSTLPFVCGHESLTGFIQVAMRRPLICKIHRDLLLGPKNDTRSLRRLHEAWAATLRALLSHYTPFFIGYGGNDDSLMDLLESLDPGEIRGRLIWCYYDRSPPSDRIRALVAQHRGALVPVPDFDVLMLLLGAKMGIEPLDHVLGERAGQRLKMYHERILGLDFARHPELVPALMAAFDRAKVGWWGWEVMARAEKDPNRREAIYREGIQQYPTSSELLGSFATFMHEVRKNADEAETLFRRALDLDPNHAIHTGNFANFMRNVRKNADEAETLFRRALDLDPNSANITGNFASFMHEVRKNADEAETLYRRALDLDPNHAIHAGNFAIFMSHVRKNADEAETFYRRALDLDPNNAIHTGNFAIFMHWVRKNADEAETLYRRALDLDPNNAIHTGNFAIFICEVRNNADEAERLYRRALDLDPNHADNMSNYCAFLLSCERLAEALPLAVRALSQNNWERNPLTGEALLYTGIIEGCSGVEDLVTLGKLKTLLQDGFMRGPWSFEPVLGVARKQLSPGVAALYEALAAAILDESKVKELDGIDAWRSIAPVPLTPTAPVH